MRHRTRVALSASAAAVAVAAFLPMAIPTAGQAPATYKAPRSAFKDGKPDLNGIWQANNTANWDLQDHAARQGPVLELGAAVAHRGDDALDARLADDREHLVELLLVVDEQKARLGMIEQVLDLLGRGRQRRTRVRPRRRLSQGSVRPGSATTAR